MKQFFLITFLWFIFLSNAFSQDSSKEHGPGLSLGTNYTFSGISVLLAFEWQNEHHIFYTGPKLPLSRTYLPLDGPFGWHLGYRHEYNKSTEKLISFFFNTDYQMAFSKAYSRVRETNKKNYVHELFVGYGVQFRISPKLYFANVLGVGAHLESYYNAELDERRLYAGYNNLFKFFLNYKF